MRSLIIFLVLYCFNSNAATILIDPGHGGVELGAHREYRKSLGHIHEKDIVLNISKKIQRELSKDHRVFLTRSIDRTVSLKERAQMAENLEADLFISVHINSSEALSSSGFETYYLDNNKDAAVNKVELCENGTFSSENPDVNHILIDLVIEKTVESSSLLADKIHSEVAKVLPKKYGIPNRGIKSGLFYVLALSKRPAVLLEVGFISNKKEAKKMLKNSFQEDYAKKVAKGVKNYLKAKKTRPIVF